MGVRVPSPALKPQLSWGFIFLIILFSDIFKCYIYYYECFIA